MSGRLSRKAFLERSGLAALGAAGVSGALERAAPARAAVAASPLPPEQHLLQGGRVVTDDGVRVNVPPLHHQVVTAELTVGRSATALAEARTALEQALRAIESRHAPTPSGLGVVVAWGTPYFRRYLPRALGQAYPAYLPTDLVASKARGATVPVLFDVQRFPSDPADVRLEANDLAVVLQSDVLAHITDEATGLFKALDGLVRVTSVRRGFVGDGFGKATSLTKTMAVRARIGGAASIPANAQLFLGFTSTQRASLGPDRIANLETLPGFTDQWPNGYFAQGTTMHLSHLYEDVGAWYDNDFADRIWLATDLSRAANSVPNGTTTLPEGAGDVQTEAMVAQFATDPVNGMVGHSASLQPVNRLPAPLRDNYGIARPKGTPILQRVDFNTLDAPFLWTSRPAVDRQRSTPTAGLHFLAFAPSTDFFERLRLAMDGRYADGTVLPMPVRDPGMGLNSVLHTTHRQHFLVPPRRHRSFPLSEHAA